MAKSVVSTQNTGHTRKPKIRRPGVVSKNKTSRQKNSKLYVKPYRSQGR